MRPTSYYLSSLLLLAANAIANPSATLSISHPWARASIPGADTGVVYLVIDNHGRQQDTLTSVSNPRLAQTIGLHAHIDDHGIMRMRAVKQIAIPAGSRVTLQPYGYHIMLEGLRQPLKAGSPFPLTLHFQKAGDLTIQVEVEPIDAAAKR